MLLLPCLAPMYAVQAPVAMLVSSALQVLLVVLGLRCQQTGRQPMQCDQQADYLETTRDTVELVICVLHCVVLMLWVIIEVDSATRSLSRGMASSLGMLSSASLVLVQYSSSVLRVLQCAHHWLQVSHELPVLNWTWCQVSTTPCASYRGLRQGGLAPTHLQIDR
jgi:hypothetical protein